MAAGKPCFCVLILLAVLALVFHLVGFVAPGWIVMERSFYENERIFESQGQLIDNGGIVAPQEDGQWADSDIVPKGEIIERRKREESGSMDDGDSSMGQDGPGHHPPHHGPHPEPHHGPHHPPHHGPHPGPHHGPGEEDAMTEEPSMNDEEMMKENAVMEDWMMTLTSEIKQFDVRTSYGLWFSTICVKDKTYKLDNSNMKDDDNKGRCHCKKISTACALFYAGMYEIPVDNIEPDAPPRKMLSQRHFGFGSLLEHRIENCVALAFMVLGLLSAIGFRKADGCKYAPIAFVIFMMLAAFISVVPVARLSHYSVDRSHQKDPVNIHFPYSALLTGLGALCALLSSLLAGFALITKARKSSSGFHQFNNETEKSEKPILVFYPDPLPVKAGLYDPCDFGVVAPTDEVKKPLPPDDEEGDDLVL